MTEELQKAAEELQKSAEEFRKLVQKCEKALVKCQKALEGYKKAVVGECRREVRRLMAEKNSSYPLILHGTTHDVPGVPFATIAELRHLHMTIKEQFPILTNDDIWLLVGVVALENICRPEVNPGHKMDHKIHSAIMGEAALALSVEDRFNRLLEAPIVQGIKSFRINAKVMAIFEINGCVKTPYASGVEVQIEINDEYPQQCPVVVFTTPISHPSVDGTTRRVLEAIPSKNGLYSLTTILSFIISLMKQKLREKTDTIRNLTGLREMFENAKESEYAATNLIFHLQNLKRVSIYQWKDWTLIKDMYDWLNNRKIHHEKPTLRLSHLLKDRLNKAQEAAEEVNFKVESDQSYQPSALCYTGRDMELHEFDLETQKWKD